MYKKKNVSRNRISNQTYIFRDYKIHWQKLQTDIKTEQNRKKEEKLLKAGKASSGEAVPLINTASSGQNIADVFFKHSDSESSEDEGMNDSDREETEFAKDFLTLRVAGASKKT